MKEGGKTCVKKRLIGMILVMVLAFMVVHALADEYTVPELDELYPGQTVRLVGKSNEQRVFAYYGPGANYYSGHGYKPYKQKTITAYFNEGGWVLIHLQYQTAKERYLYMPDTAFTSLDGVSKVYEMSYFNAVTTDVAPLRLGPADDFVSENELKDIPAGTELKVFFQKNGYVFGEFLNEETPVRMWMPASAVKIMGKGAYTPAERKRIPVKNIASMPVGEWSSWGGYDITAGDNIEVEERTLYRRKSEIEEWSEWSEEAPSEEEREMWSGFIENKDVVNSQGETVTLWRICGYNGNYGEWGEWSEDPMADAVSSSDIWDEMTQKRYRKTK